MVVMMLRGTMGDFNRLLLFLGMTSWTWRSRGSLQPKAILVNRAMRSTYASRQPN